MAAWTSGQSYIGSEAMGASVIRDPHRRAPVRCVQLGADPLEAAVDRLRLDVQRGADDLAGVPGLFVPEQFDVGRSEPRLDPQLLADGPEQPAVQFHRQGSRQDANLAVPVVIEEPGPVRSEAEHADTRLPRASGRRGDDR